jgi:hypothetical protein
MTVSGVGGRLLLYKEYKVWRKFKPSKNKEYDKSNQLILICEN